MGNKVDTLRYRGKRIRVYVDDYGQSYYFKYRGREYGCGAYNIDYVGEIIAVVDDDLDKAFHVPAIRPHTPSARLYQRYGVWRMDYMGHDGILISYGDVLRKSQRPSIGKLTETAKAQMEAILDFERDERPDGESGGKE